MTQEVRVGPSTSRKGALAHGNAGAQCGEPDGEPEPNIAAVVLAPGARRPAGHHLGEPGIVATQSLLQITRPLVVRGHDVSLPVQKPSRLLKSRRPAVRHGPGPRARDIAVVGEILGGPSGARGRAYAGEYLRAVHVILTRSA